MNLCSAKKQKKTKSSAHKIVVFNNLNPNSIIFSSLGEANKGLFLKRVLLEGYTDKGEALHSLYVHETLDVI